MITAARCIEAGIWQAEGQRRVWKKRSLREAIRGCVCRYDAALWLAFANVNCCALSWLLSVARIIAGF